MKILFLDQSGQPGGAELCLLDIVRYYGDRTLVGLFADGSFRELLQHHDIPVQIFAQQTLTIRKDSNAIQGLSSLRQLIPLITKTAQLSRHYDLIYANTQKALVVGAIASLLSRRPLVYHLHDIVSSDHFSLTNQRIIISLANRFAALVIANSEASRNAFIKAGGHSHLVRVVYNGFDPALYHISNETRDRLRHNLQLGDRFIIGQFSRLSPWKGQHILIEALKHCPETVTTLLVGDALFGEHAYVKQLHQQVNASGLEHRVKFLGFRSDIPQLMSACNLVAHTSTAPEPFGRVIVEAMLCGRPVIAAAAGGAVELVEHGQTGWLCPPNDARQLADLIVTCQQQPKLSRAIAQQAQWQASQRFNVKTTNQQIDQLLQAVIAPSVSK